MKLLLFVAITVLIACGSPKPEPLTSDGGPAVCAAGPSAPAVTVHPSAQVVGAAPNAIRYFDGWIWSVESGANTVHGYAVDSDETLTIDVGDEHSPTDVWVGPEHVWITNFVANTVTIADRQSGAVVEELTSDEFDGPAGIAGNDDFVVVGNTEFREPFVYGPGSIVVIDRRTMEVLGRRSTTAQNPQFVRAYRDDILVVNSGALGHDGERYVAGSAGSVERLAGGVNPLDDAPRVARFDVEPDSPVGVLGYPAHDGGPTVYFASGTAPAVFKLDVDSMEWLRGHDDPIRLYETEENALHQAELGPDGILYVTAFNRDQLFLVDTSCDSLLGEPVDLETSQFLAGPLGAVVLPTDEGAEAWVTMSLANELTRVELFYE